MYLLKQYKIFIGSYTFMATLAWVNILNSEWVLKHNSRHSKAFCLMMQHDRKSTTSMLSNDTLKDTIVDHGHITLDIVYHHRNFQDIKTKIRSSDLNLGSWGTLKKKKQDKPNNISKFQHLYIHLKIHLITSVNKIISSILKLKININKIQRLAIPYITIYSIFTINYLNIHYFPVPCYSTATF